MKLRLNNNKNNNSNKKYKSFEEIFKDHTFSTDNELKLHKLFYNIMIDNISKSNTKIDYEEIKKDILSGRPVNMGILNLNEHRNSLKRIGLVLSDLKAQREGESIRVYEYWSTDSIYFEVPIDYLISKKSISPTPEYIKKDLFTYIIKSPSLYLYDKTLNTLDKKDQILYYSIYEEISCESENYELACVFRDKIKDLNLS